MSGRIRTIKPEVTEDDLAAALSDSAWRMWVSMWTLADDFGDVRASDRYLASHVWQDTARMKVVPSLKLELATKVIRPGQHPMIMLYEINGEEYARIKGFPRHQRIDNGGQARVPEPTSEQSQAHALRFAETRGDSHMVRQPTLDSARFAALPPTSGPDHDHDLQSGPPTTTTEATPVSPVDEVFLHWQKTLKPGAKKTAGRLTRIRARLAEGFTGEQLRLAVTGSLEDDWLMGRTPGSRKGGYKDIDTVLRDAAQVERLIDLADLASAIPEQEPAPEDEDDPDDPDPQGDPEPMTPEKIRGLFDAAMGDSDA
ncbi:MAG: hypothetical protein WC563_15325 [Brevundimonas sp.]